MDLQQNKKQILSELESALKKKEEYSEAAQNLRIPKEEFKKKCMTHAEKVLRSKRVEQDKEFSAATPSIPNILRGLPPEFGTTIFGAEKLGTVTSLKLKIWAGINLLWYAMIVMLVVGLLMSEAYPTMLMTCIILSVVCYLVRVFSGADNAKAFVEYEEKQKVWETEYNKAYNEIKNGSFINQCKEYDSQFSKLVSQCNKAFEEYKVFENSEYKRYSPTIESLAKKADEIQKAFEGMPIIKRIEINLQAIADVDNSLGPYFYVSELSAFEVIDDVYDYISSGRADDLDKAVYLFVENKRYKWKQIEDEEKAEFERRRAEEKEKNRIKHRCSVCIHRNTCSEAQQSQTDCPAYRPKESKY